MKWFSKRTVSSFSTFLVLFKRLLNSATVSFPVGSVIFSVLFLLSQEWEGTFSRCRAPPPRSPRTLLTSNRRDAARNGDARNPLESLSFREARVRRLAQELRDARVFRYPGELRDAR